MDGYVITVDSPDQATRQVTIPWALRPDNHPAALMKSQVLAELGACSNYNELVAYEYQVSSGNPRPHSPTTR